MIKEIKKWFKGEEKIEPPETRAIVKLNEVAKESGVFDDENKIIEIHRNGKIDRIKYSEEDVDMLREQGIPVLQEDYSDEYSWIEPQIGGDVEYMK